MFEHDKDRKLLTLFTILYCYLFHNKYALLWYIVEAMYFKSSKLISVTRKTFFIDFFYQTKFNQTLQVCSYSFIYLSIYVFTYSVVFSFSRNIKLIITNRRRTKWAKSWHFIGDNNAERLVFLCDVYVFAIEIIRNLYTSSIHLTNIFWSVRNWQKGLR